MKVLFLSPFSPLADYDHAASDTVVKLIPLLAKRVDELHVYAPSHAEPIVRRPDGYFFHEGSSQRSYVASHFSRKPHWLRTDWTSADTSRALALIGRLKPDVVHAEYLQTAEVLIESQLPTSLTLHDITSTVMMRRTFDARAIEKPYRWLEWKRTAHFEKSAIGRADSVLVLSNADRDEVARHGRVAAVAAPGLDLPTKTWKADRTPTPCEVVFVGAMWRQANVLSVVRLAKKIMPHVWSVLPSAHLKIVGANPTQEVQALSGEDKRIIVTGRVDSLDDHLLRASAVALPSVLGGGVLLKVLRAMSLGCPVVVEEETANHVGADEQVVYIGRTDDQLAECIVAAVKEPELAEMRGREARNHVRTHFSWHNTTELYRRSFDRAWGRAS